MGLRSNEQSSLISQLQLLLLIQVKLHLTALLLQLPTQPQHLFPGQQHRYRLLHLLLPQSLLHLHLLLQLTRLLLVPRPPLLSHRHLHLSHQHFHDPQRQSQLWEYQLPRLPLLHPQHHQLIHLLQPHLLLQRQVRAIHLSHQPAPLHHLHLLLG